MNVTPGIPGERAEHPPLPHLIGPDPASLDDVASSRDMQLNLNRRDNLLQAQITGVCVLAGVVIGLAISGGGIDGAVVGVLAGLVGGLLLSGIVLAVRHRRRR